MYMYIIYVLYVIILYQNVFYRIITYKDRNIFHDITCILRVPCYIMEYIKPCVNTLYSIR